MNEKLMLSPMEVYGLVAAAVLVGGVCVWAVCEAWRLVREQKASAARRALIAEMKEDEVVEAALEEAEASELLSEWGVRW